MSEVIDLSAARELRAQTPAETLMEAVEALDRAIKALGTPTEPDEAKQLTKLLTERAAVLKRLERAREAERKEAQRQAIASIPVESLEDEIKTNLRTFLKEKDMKFVEANRRFWLYYPSKWEGEVYNPAQWIPVPKGDLCLYNTDLEPKASNEHWRLFNTVLREDGRVFRDMKYSFDKLPSTTLNMLDKRFLEPITGERAHWFFEALMMSLGGGKAENKKHLEQIIVAAYVDPANNYLRPCQVFDDGGNTGKTLFATKVLSTLFGQDLVIPSVDIGALSGFNAHLAGKVVVFINEVSQEKEDSNALRRVLGSKQYKLEFKGVDAMFADNTAIYFISGNNMGVGAVKLMNNGVDRRYSMHCPDRPLAYYVSQCLSPEDVGREDVEPVGEDEANAWIRKIGQHVLCDPDQVSRWIGDLIERHGPVTDVPALHGEDYRKILQGQRGTHERVFECIFNDPNFTHIKRRTLYQFFKSEDPQAKMRNETFYKLAEEWIKKHKHDIRVRLAQRWGDSSADVYVNEAYPPAKIINNDSDFFTKNEHGRVTWHVELPS